MSQKCFVNKTCRYFPCHGGVDPADFNCMFCYCPLYALGRDCGGTPVYLSNGVKDCSHCALPHRGERGWTFVQRHIGQIVGLAREQTKESQPPGDRKDKDEP